MLRLRLLKIFRVQPWETLIWTQTNLAPCMQIAISTSKSGWETKKTIYQSAPDLGGPFDFSICVSCPVWQVRRIPGSLYIFAVRWDVSFSRSWPILNDAGSLAHLLALFAGWPCIVWGHTGPPPPLRGGKGELNFNWARIKKHFASECLVSCAEELVPTLIHIKDCTGRVFTRD